MLGTAAVAATGAGAVRVLTAVTFTLLAVTVFAETAGALDPAAAELLKPVLALLEPEPAPLALELKLELEG